MMRIPREVSAPLRSPGAASCGARFTSEERMARALRGIDAGDPDSLFLSPRRAQRLLARPGHESWERRSFREAVREEP